MLAVPKTADLTQPVVIEIGPWMSWLQSNFACSQGYRSYDLLLGASTVFVLLFNIGKK